MKTDNLSFSDKEIQSTIHTYLWCEPDYRILDLYEIFIKTVGSIPIEYINVRELRIELQEFFEDDFKNDMMNCILLVEDIWDSQFESVEIIEGEPQCIFKCTTQE